MAMRRHEQLGRARIALVTAAALLAQPVAPAVARGGANAPQAQKPATTSAPATQKPATTATQKPATTATQKPAAATVPAVNDLGWPRDYQTASGLQFTIYQPQIADWPNQKRMSAYAAVSVQQPGQQKPALGTVKIEANTKVSLDARLVNFSDMTLVEPSFPTLAKEKVREVTDEILKGVPAEDRIISLDRVLEQVDKSLIVPKNVEGIKADPPVIFFSKTPAIIVNIDGDPLWSPIKENDLKFAVNTNWDLFQHTPTNTHYLLYNGSWLTAADLQGTWAPAGKLPESFAKLPNDDNWKETKAAVPGKKLDAKKAPRVFVSTAPAELILLTGEPSYVLVSGTNLLWVSNSESDLFRMGKTGPVYFLVSGRWFSAPDFKGPWAFATPTLPEDFKKIPLEHARSRVLASVPGTAQAAEAVLLAQIPQTARVQKSLKAPEVAYDGDPKFEPIEKTSVSRAVNTDKDIIKVGDMYYMCFQGVWFMGKSPTGPWEVTGSVPGQIYEIPVSSPSHSVTYVTVEDDDDDAVVFATALAFTGVMIAWGCCVWGSGWYYPPHYGWYGGYPHYYGHYPTYGFHASYNPWTGTYGRGVSAYGPYGGAGVGARYNPRTGTYARGAAAYGPYGARGAAQAYNPRTGGYGQTRQGSNVYGSWGSTQVARGDDWASTSRVTNNRTGTTTRVSQGSGGGESVRRTGQGGTTTVGRTGSGDVYAGHDGNVYKKSGDSWQKSDGGGNWSDVSQPSQAQKDQARSQAEQARGQGAQAGTTRTTQGADRAGTTGASQYGGGSTVGQLDRDATARTTGTQRTRDAGTVRSGSSGGYGTGSSTYRPSGGSRSGGARAGGGRRR
jgi:hypothetical protein